MRLVIFMLIIASSLIAQELKITAKKFDTDEKKGVSVFQGSVNIVKVSDELNASKVTVYTDAKHQPTKFEAVGDVSFRIKTQDGISYVGKAGKVIYKPISKEYYFYHDVHLLQLGDKKEIIGEEVVLKTIDGKAYARGLKDAPVIMIFNIPDEKEK